jgi:rubrerythrin
VPIVKAASLVEHNGRAYAHHLCRVFADDPEFQQTAKRWGEEEVTHGRALARWATLADPEFDFDSAFARFREGFRVDFDSDRSRRGSRAGEMVARCVVEIGTSSYYTALREAAREPVLQEICRHIAADELRHYRLFYKNLDRYLAQERIGRLGRLLVALGRVAESDDDELAYAYYAANETGRLYDRGRCNRAYARRVYALYRPHHVERGVAMLLKAAGLTPNGRLGLLTSRLAWRAMRYRANRLAKAAT